MGMRVFVSRHGWFLHPRSTLERKGRSDSQLKPKSIDDVRDCPKFYILSQHPLHHNIASTTAIAPCTPPGIRNHAASELDPDTGSVLLLERNRVSVATSS